MFIFPLLYIDGTGVTEKMYKEYGIDYGQIIAKKYCQEKIIMQCPFLYKISINNAL